MSAPTAATTFAAPRIEAEQRPDGRLLLRSTEPLREHPASVVHSFRMHAEMHPDRLLVAQRGADGEWATSTWGEVRVQADRIAQGLLDRGLADRPVMVLSGNSRLHLTVTVAAMTVGAPVVPTSVAYSLQSTDHAKLREMADLRPVVRRSLRESHRVQLVRRVTKQALLDHQADAPAGSGQWWY